MDHKNINIEDPEAIAESVRQEWNALHHLLGLNQLPGIEALNTNPNNQQNVDTRVAQAVVGLIVRTRSGIADQARLTELLRDELGRERAMTAPSTPANSIARTKEQIGESIAEAYLKVIFRHVEKRDIEQLVRELPAAIRPTDRPATWTVNAVPGFPIPNPTRNISIDLRHPIWRIGSEQQIRARLAGKTPAQAGLTIDPPLPPGGALDSTMIDAIFLSSRDVIDPNLPVGQVMYENFPATGQRVIVDVPGLLRSFPEVAVHDGAALRNWFVTTPAHYQTFIRGEAMLTGLPFDLTPVQNDDAINRLHAQMGRNPGQSLSSARHSLATAIGARQPLDRLIQGTADNRELLLALAALQRDPIALSAMNPDDTAVREAELNRNIVTSATSIEAHQVVALPNGINPASTLQAIDNFITELGTATTGNIGALETHRTAFQATEAADRAALQTYSQATLPTWEAGRDTRNQIIQSNKDQIDAYTLALTSYSERQSSAAKAVAKGGIFPFTEPPPKDPAVAPTSLVPVPPAVPKPAPPTPTAFTPLPIAGNFACTVHSMDELRAKLAEFHSLVRELESAQREIEKRGASVLELYNFMIQRNINVAANAPQLHALIQPVPAPPVFLRNIVAANTNWSAIIAEARAAIPGGLKTADEYTAEITELRSKNKPLEGSDACWAIVRRSLEDQGMRPAKAETTMQYMKNQLQHSEESVRSTEDLTRSVYGYVGDRERNAGFMGFRNGPAAKEWQKDKSYRKLRTLGLTKYSPDLQRYKAALFNAGAIGITLEQGINPISRSLPLGRLMDAYFRTKYLMELPENDPRRLPSESQEMVTLMRNLHSAILERAQLGLQNPSAGTQEEREKLGIQQGMTKAERLDAVQSYLLNGKAENTAVLEKIINRAYEPIKRKTDGHANAKKFWGNRAKNLKGEGSVFNPLTSVAKTGKLIFRILNAEI